MRYGRDFYDERMQATKVVHSINGADELPAFDLVDLNAKTTSEAAKTKDIEEKLAETKLRDEEQAREEEKTEEGAEVNEAPKPELSKPSKSKDPLRWFGILSPPCLCQAQRSASTLVETAVKLSSVDTEMKGVEIEIRRARKRKAKNQKPSSMAENVEEGRGSEVGQQTKHETAKVNRGGGCGRVAI